MNFLQFHYYLISYCHTGTDILPKCGSVDLTLHYSLKKGKPFVVDFGTINKRKQTNVEGSRRTQINLKNLLVLHQCFSLHLRSFSTIPQRGYLQDPSQ